MELNTPERVQYGGSSAQLTLCPRCGRSPDQHRLANILPSDETTAAVVRFGEALTAHVLRLKDIQKETREEFMIGAVTANVGGKVVRWLANSGANVLPDKTLGEWEVVHHMPAELGEEGCYGVGGLAFVPTMPQGVTRTECAAPKLLCNLLKIAGGRDILSIRMTELWWKNPVTKSEEPNRKWNQLRPVHSCETCRRFLPQMLCDRPDVGLEGFTPAQALPRGVQMHEVHCVHGHVFSMAIADDAWRAYGANPQGVKTRCPKCKKEVACHDPQRPRTSVMFCVYCDKPFTPKSAVTKDTWSHVRCTHCDELGKYRKVEVLEEGQRVTKIESKRLGSK
ncbi:hypothetical protein [Methylibium rhizosphaerae]|uniref:hypothetical protein n=1 Tax=Methylibium rhizosphaerae TaxID=2570323 RepID=UPI001128E64D|nr:hypothetical protein [Methylibium rhizosphaerae]